MSLVLVVEESAEDVREIRDLLEQAGFEVEEAGHASAALEAIGVRRPDLILTDLNLSGMDGLSLLASIQTRQLGIPSILMSSAGTEEIVAQAMRRGASGYLAKRNLERDMIDVIDDVLSVNDSRKQQDHLIERLTSTESRFTLDNDAAFITPLIGYVQKNLNRLEFCDESTLIRIGVALREAVVNAIQHGNLEVSSEIKGGDDDLFYRLVEERRHLAPYADRRVHVVTRESRDEAVFIVADEGPGFDPTSLPDPTDPANIFKEYGRGLFLIRSFMDEVRHNPEGNEITMTKRRVVK